MTRGGVAVAPARRATMKQALARMRPKEWTTELRKEWDRVATVAGRSDRGPAQAALCRRDHRVLPVRCSAEKSAGDDARHCSHEIYSVEARQERLADQATSICLLASTKVGGNGGRWSPCSGYRRPTSAI